MVFPNYDGGSLADIPGTIFSLFDIDSELSELNEDIIDVEKDYQNVILILVDGLGTSQLENFSSGIFEEIRDIGGLESITSVFPSATPATLTSINTGKTPKEHGLLGWEMYYEEIDSKLFTLPFITVDGERAQEAFTEADSRMLFEGEPIYPKLKDNGINCFSIIKREIIDGEYTELTAYGSEKVSYHNTADMALQIRKTLEERKGRKYIYAYTADIDSIAHIRGPKTEDEANQLEMISNALKRNLVENISDDIAEDTLILITADHGQIKHGEKIDLFSFDEVTECIETDIDGELITPSGNAGRSVFLHVKDGRVNDIYRFLNQKLDAKVLKTEEALEEGYFGQGEKAEDFDKRAGDIVIISDKEKLHWGETSELEDIGVHGGLHEEEMRIPLMKAKLSELKK